MIERMTREAYAMKCPRSLMRKLPAVRNRKCDSCTSPVVSSVWPRAEAFSRRLRWWVSPAEGGLVHFPNL